MKNFKEKLALVPTKPGNHLCWKSQKFKESFEKLFYGNSNW